MYDETFSGMEKVNFAGGEPFIVKRGAYLGELVRFCKEDLQLPSVTVVSNGSLITEKWFEKYGEFNYHVHILLMDCQSPKNLASCKWERLYDNVTRADEMRSGDEMRRGEGG